MGNIKALVARILAVVLLGCAALGARASVYVYDNSTSDQTNRLAAVDNLKFGDEVTLGANYPANPMMTHFDFLFWATNTTALTVDVELRLNDGPTFNGYATPGTLVYGYYGYALSDTARSTLGFDAGTDFSSSGLYLAGDTLTLCVNFHFNGGGGTAGVDLYNPPTEGSSYIDYWQYNGSNWELTTNNVFATVNFGIRIEAVPEPTVFAIFALGGLAAFGVRRLVCRA
ncbi:MAG: hypothetical protein RLY20_1303 [Verrucomicrobiota bacterium]|jgi:hypothetical protein